MIKAKFQFRRNGILYKKGDPLQMTEDDRMEAVYSGLAYYEPVSMDNTKAEIQAYLTQKNISFDSSATKSELLALLP